MNRYLRKYRTGGSDSRKVSRIGSPPITDFVNVPRGNPNRQGEVLIFTGQGYMRKGGTK
jgi:hypothetical protein